MERKSICITRPMMEKSQNRIWFWDLVCWLTYLGLAIVIRWFKIRSDFWRVEIRTKILLCRQHTVERALLILVQLRTRGADIETDKIYLCYRNRGVNWAAMHRPAILLNIIARCRTRFDWAVQKAWFRQICRNWDSGITNIWFCYSQTSQQRSGAWFYCVWPCQHCSWILRYQPGKLRLNTSTLQMCWTLRPFSHLRYSTLPITEFTQGRYDLSSVILPNLTGKPSYSTTSPCSFCPPEPFIWPLEAFSWFCRYLSDFLS